MPFFTLLTVVVGYFPLLFFRLKVSQGFDGIPSWEQLSPTGIEVYSICIVIVFCCYLLLTRIRIPWNRTAWVWFSFLGILLACTPPVLSIDAVTYLAFSKVYLFHGNPYFTTLASAASEPWVYLLKNSGWLGIIYPYGPLFALFSVPFAIFSNMTTALVAYKLALFICFAFSVRIFERVRQEYDLHPCTTYLYALNPAFLIQGLLEGHNDILVAVCLVFVLFFLKKDRWKMATTAIATAATLKYYPFMMLPICWVDRKKFSWKRFLVSSTLTVIIFLTVSAPFRFPFLQFAHSLAFQATGVHYFNINIRSPSIHLLETLFGSAGSMIGKDIFVAGFLGCLALLFTGRFTRPQFLFVTYSLLILFGLTWLTPWYVIPLVPLAFFVTPSRRVMLWIIGFLALYSMIGY